MLKEELAQGRSLRVWMSDQQWITLLEQVERSARDYAEGQDSAGEERRAGGTRHPFRLKCAMRTQSPEGKSATYMIQCRNISEGGLGFLTHDWMEPKSRCTVALQGTEGQGLIASAIVAWCRPIRNEDAYEVGVQFERPIDVTPFVGEHPAAG